MMRVVRQKRVLTMLAIMACMVITACPSKGGLTGPIESAEDKATARKVCSFVTMNNIKAIQKLADDGENIGARGTGNESPLHIAAEKGYLDIAKLLVENGADVNAKTKQQGKSPFNYALEFAHPEIAMFLFESGTPVNGVDGGGTSNLSWAILVTNMEAVKYLVDRGADPNIADENGETPIFFAAFSSYQGIEKIEILLNAGANISHKNNFGETALASIMTSEYEGDQVVAENAEYLRNRMK